MHWSTRQWDMFNNHKFTTEYSIWIHFSKWLAEMPDCIPNVYGFPDFFFFLICLSLLFPNINPYPLAARLCRNSWLQRRVKCKTCVGLSSFYPACLFLDSCRLIWSLGAQKREKSPIVTARSWARNVLEAGEEKKKTDQTKRKEKTCRYPWNKVCFHLHEEQGPS